MSNDRITEADIRLYMTLIRFDEVYVVYFKTSKKAVREYPNMLNYLRELYQVPELRETTFMNHIKFHYFTSHSALNFYRFYNFILYIGSLVFTFCLALYQQALTRFNFSRCRTIDSDLRTLDVSLTHVLYSGILRVSYF